jgi:hypothetical protein
VPEGHSITLTGQNTVSSDTSPEQGPLMFPAPAIAGAICMASHTRKEKKYLHQSRVVCGLASARHGKCKPREKEVRSGAVETEAANARKHMGEREAQPRIG